MRRLISRCAAAAGCIALALGAAACDTSISVTTQGQPEGPVLAVGVATDEPALGWIHNGTNQGFDVDVAKYVAKVLGYGGKQVSYVPVTLADAGQKLNDGDVSFVVAAYPRTEETERDVTFAAPYLAVNEIVLTRAANGAEDSETVSSLSGLDGKAVCVVDGSPAGKNLKKKVPGVRIETQSGYAQCVSSLLTGKSAAIAAGAPVVYGLAEQSGTEYVSVLDELYGTETYGIAVPKGQDELAGQIKGALEAMVADGSWQQAADSLRDACGYEVDMAINPPEGI